MTLFGPTPDADSVQLPSEEDLNRIADTLEGGPIAMTESVSQALDNRSHHASLRPDGLILER